MQVAEHMVESTPSGLAHVCFEGARRLSARKPVKRSLPGAASSHVPDPAGFTTWLLSLAGIDASKYRARPLERRLPACFRALKVTSEEEARRRVLERPQLLAAAVGSMLIGVTEFFRDPAVFSLLSRVVAPRLAASGGDIRVLSAGCSTGAELYSTAIVLAEAGVLERSVLVGVDCRRAALAQARLGMFTGADVAGVRPEWRHRYFEQLEADLWRPIPAIQRRMDWQYVDLTVTAPSGPWDLVLCRNVSIYLADRVSAQMWERLAAELAPAGALIVGQAERVPDSLGLSKAAKSVNLRTCRDEARIR